MENVSIASEAKSILDVTVDIERKSAITTKPKRNFSLQISHISCKFIFANTIIEFIKCPNSNGIYIYELKLDS